MIQHEVVQRTMKRVVTLLGGSSNKDTTQEQDRPTRDQSLIIYVVDEVALDTRKKCDGVKDTRACLRMGYVEMLISWEMCDLERLRIQTTPVDIAQVVCVAPQEGDIDELQRDPELGARLDAAETQP